MGELSKNESFLLVHNAQIRAAAPIKRNLQLCPPEIAQSLNRCNTELGFEMLNAICTAVHINLAK
jgi:hypothetical protein